MKSPLLEVETLGVAFSVWEVLWGDHVIRHLSIENGEISLEKFSNNTWNFDITDSSNISLEVSAIELESIDINYTENGKETSRGFVKSAHISNNFADVSLASLAGSVNEVFQPFYGGVFAEYSIDTLGNFTAAKLMMGSTTLVLIAKYLLMKAKPWLRVIFLAFQKVR